MYGLQDNLVDGIYIISPLQSLMGIITIMRFMIQSYLGDKTRG